MLTRFLAAQIKGVRDRLFVGFSRGIHTTTSKGTSSCSIVVQASLKQVDTLCQEKKYTEALQALTAVENDYPQGEKAIRFYREKIYTYRLKDGAITKKFSPSI